MLKLRLIAALTLLVAGSVVWAQECTKEGHGQAAGHKCSATCPMSGHEIVKTTKEVTLKGQILCKHCDLHQADKCQKVLVTAEKRVYQFCPESVDEKKANLDSYSRKQVEVKGTLYELKEAESVIHLESIKPAA